MSFYKQYETGSNGDYKIVPSRSGGPCACGDPNSNCSSGRNPWPKILFENQAPEDKVMWFVEEDVVVERKVAGETTTTVVLATKGSYITRAKAVELGLVEPD